MEWQIIVALAIGIPVVLFPLVFVWFLNISGIYTVIRETRKRRIAREKRLLTTQIVKS